jgi:O-acetyl-ADP-ribose deacetylase (regulator of RNase III)
MEIIRGTVFDGFLYPNSLVVHGCNAQGVMGSGVAKVVRNDFPAAYYEYVRRYEESGLKLGDVIPVMVLPGRHIINAITQEFYGTDGKRYVNYHAIEVCFGQVRKFADQNGIETINYPMIGAGLGGGNWDEIAAIIDSQLEGYNHFLWVP